jgi:hypothetical protein
MNVTEPTTPLKDVLYAFSLAKSIPDADLLDEFARRYPKYATALTDFAISIVLDFAHGEDETSSEAIEPTVSKAVSRAMSRFQNRLFELQQFPIAHSRVTTLQPFVVNPFDSLDRKAYRAIAERLHCNTVFLSMLRDREIEATTIPERFTRLVSEELKIPMELLAAHFAAQPEIRPGQFYKSEEKPKPGNQISFEEAIRKSGLTEAQQEYLLGLRP